MIVRRATSADHPVWAQLLSRLHPDQSPTEFEAELQRFTKLEQPYIAFLAESDDSEPIGMIDLRVRNYAEGAEPGPVAYVEDLWVEPVHRRAGVGRALLAAAEQWARDEGLGHLGSDALSDNEDSRAWHLANGFTEVERITVFAKRV